MLQWDKINFRFMHIGQSICTVSMICVLSAIALFPRFAFAEEALVYRFYSEVYDSHFYTVNTDERTQLLSNGDWQYEGVAAQAQTQELSKTTALYRFWSADYRSHFFTTSIAERDYLIANDPIWSYEGIAYYVYPEAHDDTTPFYRFWSTQFRSHFYTASLTEKDYLIANDANWTYEGIAYHAKPFEAGDGTILLNNFETNPLGQYDDAAFQADTSWPRVTWSETSDRASIMSASGDRKLRITYPAGGVGTGESGGQAVIDLGNDFSDLSFRQSVRFEEGFDWQRGGKLPGLSSDGSQWSGGNAPRDGEGYSARYMWRDGGRAVLYLYHADQGRSYGDEIDLGFSFEAGKEYTLTQRIVRNSEDKRNGLLDVWMSVDGSPHQKVLERRDVLFGRGDAGYTDSLYFSTYFGGGDSTWAPDTISYATFDDFIVTQSGFNDLP